MRKKSVIVFALPPRLHSAGCCWLLNAGIHHSNCKSHGRSVVPSFRRCLLSSTNNGSSQVHRSGCCSAGFLLGLVNSVVLPLLLLPLPLFVITLDLPLQLSTPTHQSHLHVYCTFINNYYLWNPARRLSWLLQLLLLHLPTLPATVTTSTHHRHSFIQPNR